MADQMTLTKTKYFETVEGLEWELWRGRHNGREVICWIPAWVPAQLFQDAVEMFPDAFTGQKPAAKAGTEVKPRRVLRGNKRKE